MKGIPIKGLGFETFVLGNTLRLEDKIMKILGNSGMNPMNTVPKVKNNQDVAQTSKGASFDQITFNTRENMDENSRIQKEMVAKISHEVRTHNTTGKIAQLREEVQSGTYQVDAREIAARMFLIGDVE